ncbi:hypothetical protein SLEP1_g24503 [Rubroshorea leprosula]|uniref:Uncharacterized protein n=1 Tax=Rubroshorea leprosula TaxID=152421 RepID=A0AAV5JQC1_9ROSI|nr:hypothetical protein SLEP1_g24503 [Rubroshorea leprosula]
MNRLKVEIKSPSRPRLIPLLCLQPLSNRKIIKFPWLIPKSTQVLKRFSEIESHQQEAQKKSSKLIQSGEF